MIELPDVNVLVALLDGMHVHHRTAKIWFDAAANTGWATCPLTISGVIRVISRPQVSSNFTVSDVRDLLAALIQANRSSHHFWTDRVDLLDERLFDLTKIQGYRQVSDLHLLALAHRNRGVLVTLDAGLNSTVRALRSATEHSIHLLAPQA